MTDKQPERTNAESESRYRQLRDAVADYHYQVRVENGQVAEKLHGPKCEAITGYSPEEYAARPRLWFEIVAEEDRAAVERQVSQVLAGQEPTAIEYRICRKDGQSRWIWKLIIPYHDDQGQLTAYDGLLHDITERKQAEEALRKSERRYRLLFEDDLTGDYVATPDGAILLCNRAFASMFGFASCEQAVGSNLVEFYQDPDSWPRLVERLREIKSIERSERVTRRNDGAILHIVENVLGTFDEQGNLVRIKGYMFDDTRSRLEAAKLHQHNTELEQAVLERTRVVREKHSHIEAILNSAFDAIITIDSQGIIHTVNRAAERVFGYSASEMIGQNVKMLMPTPHRAAHDGYLQRYLAKGEKRILDAARELVACRKDGSTFPIEISITEVDHLKMFTGIIHDISERKQLQTHILSIAAEEQRRIGQELHDGTGQELTGLALHAGTLVEVLDAIPQQELQGQKQRVLTERGFNKLRALAATISSRLDATNLHIRRLAHGIMPVQIDPEGLQTALEELAASIGTQRQVSCRYESTLSIIQVNHSTATHLYRIAQEAVSNALRHSQANAIVISLRLQGEQIVLEISDNGVGINGVNASGGTTEGAAGLGLRTMRYRCGMIGGSFHLERNEAGGTSVKCIVPGNGGCDD
jgi:two-component system, LuxR family, sensor kinase FixL